MNAISIPRRTRSFVAALLSLAAAACEASDPSTTEPTDGGLGADATPAATCSTESNTTPTSSGEAATCVRPAGDYDPNGGSDDGWPSCISDGNVYVPFEPSISALSRVAAFDQIRARLGFGTTRVPTPEDFVEARVLYSQDQGIESRIARREDEHYPAATKLCRDMSEQELREHRERCVGPAVLRPLLNDAFVRGIAGEAPEVQAARIEGALLAWLYFSIFKEATSAKDAAKDVDSMWAKYSGGKTREESQAVGLARYVKALAPEVHERIYDGLLAVRCWRDLDNPTGIASDTALQLRARGQLDRALLRGMALLTIQRAEATAACGTAWETVRIIGGFLVREAKARNAARGLELEAALASGASSGAPRVAAILRDVFPCP